MRILGEEDGFTLVEMLVTMMLMLLAMFALYSIFDMSLRVFSFGNDKVEATENARLGLGRMEREIRAAYPYNKPADVDEDHLLWDPASPATPVTMPPDDDQISFGNDLDGNRIIECPTPEIEPRCETITYQLSPNAPYSLERISSAVGDPEPVVEFVQPDGLAFEYLKSDGTTPAATEEDVTIVSIELSVDVDGREQTLSTDVALRNRPR
jgi:prepilin-type N-terminal cleavage/methylation domain-containing protein